MTNKTCVVDGCQRAAGMPGTARGMCSMHYSRFVQKGDPLAPTRERLPRAIQCSITGCLRKPVTKGMCQLHYDRVRSTGDAGPVGLIQRPEHYCRCGARISRHRKRCASCLKEDRLVPSRKCNHDGCEKTAVTRGFCAAHDVVSKTYAARWASEKRARRRAQVSAIKLEKGCIDCGYNAHAAALDFDHLDPSSKSFEISQCLGSVSEEKLIYEMSKCVVRCANCHRVRTFEEKKNYVTSKTNSTEDVLNGENLSEHMLKAGAAKAYSGKGKRG